MKLLDEGYPMRQLSRETKIVRSRLYIWRKRYIYYGEEGLRRKAPHHVSESEIASIKADLMGMADMGLKAKIKRVKYRSYKGEIGSVAPNVIARDFKTTGINQKWATDITEYKINDEKGYLSPILDMNNGEIVAYARSRHPDLNLVMKMVDEAITRKNPPKGLILHSDQG